MGRSKRTEMTEGVELVFYGNEPGKESVLTARRGLILPKEKRMEVFEQVVFVNAKGERLETERVKLTARRQCPGNYGQGRTELTGTRCDPWHGAGCGGGF